MEAILFFNARIWRKNGDLYSWVLFSKVSGKILQCGHDIPPSNISAKNVIDLKQRWVFPGFHDCHLHISDLGKHCGKFNLNFPKTVKEFKNRLKVMAKELSSSDEWLIGYGYDHHIMDRPPTAEDIDSVIPANPVVLYRVCMHICVVNTAMLSLIGVTKDTKNPENGRIGRYSNTHHRAGEADGVLYEDGGLNLVNIAMPEISNEHKKQHICTGLQKCLELGLTSVHTCDGGYWNAYVELAKSNLLPIHCYCSPYCTDFGTSNFPSFAGETHNNLTCEFVKVFVDGALRVETAALSVPYLQKNLDGSDNYGILQKSEEEFEDLMSKINNAGFRIEIHVIGDRAAEMALSFIEKCKILPEKRPLFVHCQILREELLDRMKKCGVVPTVQPSFVPTDASWIKENLPEQLKKCIYPWKTLLQKGITCGGSSDAPVETVNPLQGIYDAIFRPSSDGIPFEESECLTFQEAVGLYTTGSAFADGVESIKGQLEVGYQADMVILNVPCSKSGIPLDLPENPSLLKETHVEEVWIKGCKLLSTTIKQ